MRDRSLFPVLTPEQIVSAWAGVLGGFDATQHLITNHLVNLDGAKALCTAEFQATHLCRSVTHRCSSGGMVVLVDEAAE